MKKKALVIIMTTVLSLSMGMGLVFAGPASAADDVLYGTIGGKYLVTIDHTTGDAAEVAIMNGGIDGVYAIAFDWHTDTLFGLARADGTVVPKLATIDVCTGAVTVIGNIDLPDTTEYFAEGIAIDPEGTIYVSMSIDGGIPSGDYYSETLVTVDADTASATYVATISGTVQNEADGLEFVDGTLYASDDPGSGPTNIYTLAMSGAATLEGTLSSPRFNNVGDMAYNSTEGLFGTDPGAYTNGTPRHLCKISQPGTATATDIGLTHKAAEFDGGLLSGLSWGSACNQPPDCSEAYTNLCCLWPPNHKFVDISIMGVTDPDGDPVTITITSITSDEPTATDKGSGGAKHAPDATGIGTDTASVRAERSGRGDGRVYVINFIAEDGRGGVCERGSVMVKVPHDQSDKACPATDSGQDYDATDIN